MLFFKCFWVLKVDPMPASIERIGRQAYLFWLTIFRLYVITRLKPDIVQFAQCSDKFVIFVNVIRLPNCQYDCSLFLDYAVISNQGTKVSLLAYLKEHIIILNLFNSLY